MRIKLNSRTSWGDSGWYRHFAFIPVRIDDSLVWLQFVEKYHNFSENGKTVFGDKATTTTISYRFERKDNESSDAS